MATLPTTWSGAWTNANLPVGWTNFGLGADYAGTGGTGYDGVGGGAARFDTMGDMLTIHFDSAPGEISYWIVRNGTATSNLSFVVEESDDGSTYGAVATYAYADLPTSAATGGRTNALSASSRYARFNYVLKPSGCNVGIDGVAISAGSGVVTTNVKFTASAAAVDETPGTYAVTVIKTVASGDVSGSVALSGTATEGAGADYTVDTTNFTMNGATTSATFTVTINDDADQETAETVILTLAGVTGGGVASPSVFTLTINANDVASHAIAITPPTNGTVTTSPTNTAQEGATVTITATPAGGYRVASIAVVDGSATPVTVTGNTFVMPASDVTVTVLFETYAAPDVVIDFEDYTGTYGSNNYSAGGTTWALTNAYSGNTVDDARNGTKSGRFENNRGGAGHPAIMMQTAAFAQPITKINFWYANYGVNDGGAFKVQVSSDGSSWTDVGAAEYNPSSKTLVEGVIDVIPANMTYAQIVTTTGSAQRVNIDDVGFYFGAAIFGVTFDKSSGFTVEQGASDAITATAANGTAPYGYSWSSSLGGAYYAASNNVFTILATAPIGDYSAQVIATDATAAAVTNTINFSVVAPVVKYGIAIVTNAPANGTVTTTPATEAAAGATVTVNATPAGGYALQSIAVVDEAMNPVTVTGTTFTMPASAVTVTATFAEHTGSSLIISEVADPSDNANARFVELYNAGGSSIDLAAGTWFLCKQVNGGTTWDEVALTGTVAAGSTYVIAFSTTNYTAAYPTAPAPNQANGNVSGNGDDAYFLFSGGRHTNGVMEDALGVLDQDGTGMAWEYLDRRAVRQTAVTAGNPTWTASEWTIPTAAGVADMTPGVHPEGAAVFGVTFNKTSGFTVEQGASDAITATAANGTAPYGYSWSSSLGGAYYAASGNVFTILATAPVGDYSAQVIATDSSAPTQSVTNSLNFSVVVPPTKYALTIVTNDPANGTVTTTPATEAAAGATVTVTATPAEGYRVASLVVNGGAVTVTGNTFTMPAAPATVTVTFEAYEAPDVLIDFETVTGFNSYSAGTSTVSGVSVSHLQALRGTTAGSDRFNGAAAARIRYLSTNVGFIATTAAFAQPITQITFFYANYGSDSNGAFKVQVSDDGATWQDVGAAEYNPDSTALTMATIDSVPANMTYLQFIMTGGASQRVSLDDVGVYFGAPAFSVAVNKLSGFTVNEGASDTITATAANGTAPYTYAWTSTLGASYRTTNANVFTILATAPTGSYSATVTATDAALATAQKTVTFSVVGIGPGPAVIISGSRSGTVGVEMSLGVSVTNETANDWFIDLKDPTGTDDYSYGFDGSTFTLTPTMTGTYVLAVTAQTGSGNYSNTANLAISSGGGGATWQIGNPGTGGSMFYSTSNQNIVIVLPTNYNLTAVYGTDSSATGLNNLGRGLGSPLTQGVDYNWNPATRTISVLSGVTNRRVLRIGASAP